MEFTYAYYQLTKNALVSVPYQVPIADLTNAGAGDSFLEIIWEVYTENETVSLTDLLSQ